MIDKDNLKIKIYGEFESGATGGFVADLSQIKNAKEALDTKVDKITGKQLSTNDYTTTEKNKLSAIEENAQVNDLESVYVNNFPVEVKSDTKRVNLNIPSKYDNPIVSVTYAELKSLRNSKNLIPGTMYKIIDFVISANDSGILNCNQSEIEGVSLLGNKFTLLVTAKDEKNLFSSAQILSSDNGNFDRDAWNVDYSLDNDIAIFPEESVFSGCDYNKEDIIELHRFPFNPFYRNSLLQQLIFREDFLGDIPETINMLSFKTYEYYGKYVDNNKLRVYLTNVSNLESLENFIAVSEDDLYFEGAFNLEGSFNGVASITLSKPFIYKGGDIIITTVGIVDKIQKSFGVGGCIHPDSLNRIGYFSFDNSNYVFDPYILPYNTINGSKWDFNTDMPGIATSLLFSYNNQATGHLTLTPKEEVVNIRGISVNGVAQTVSNNTVEISVPTKVSELENDSNYISEASVDDKVETSGTSTKSYVDTKYNTLKSSLEDQIKANSDGLNQEITDRQNAITTYLQESKNYTDTKVASLVGTAPETLDTLQEVAQAIQDNDTVVEALNAAIGGKADKTEIPQFIYAAGLGDLPDERDSRTVFLVGNKQSKIITFYIDEGSIKTYNAEEGMTWKKWAESNYCNDNNIEIGDDYLYYRGHDIWTADYAVVKLTDTIISEHKYLNSMYYGGSN